MALRAVVFDYGMVLTGRPDPQAHAAMVHISGLPLERFETLYWADRRAYDEGRLTGIAFWQKFLRDGNLRLPAAAVEELNRWDVRMWSTQNPRLIAWQAQLKQCGLRTAILSNMGDAVHQHIQAAYPWLANFDVLVWSYQLRLAKPDPAIYRHTLAQLGTEPAATLFIDDNRDNIATALSLGMKAIQFSTVEQLRADLVSSGLDAELPLPA